MKLVDIINSRPNKLKAFKACCSCEHVKIEGDKRDIVCTRKKTKVAYYNCCSNYEVYH